MKLIINNKPGKAQWLARLEFYLQNIYRDRDITSTQEEYTRLQSIIEVKLESLKTDNILERNISIIKNSSEILLKENSKIIQIYKIE